MAQTPEGQDWRSLAAQASQEKDEEKLLFLVQQLCNAFDEGHKPPQSEHSQNRSVLEDAGRLRKPTANLRCQ